MAEVLGRPMTNTRFFLSEFGACSEIRRGVNGNQNIGISTDTTDGLEVVSSQITWLKFYN